MYASFFGLNQDPFSIAPDPRYLFMSERHREALAHLLYGLDGGGGFVLLTGEVGTGKTTVCRCFLEQIPQHCNVAYIFNPKLTVGELLQVVCDEFGIAHSHSGPGPETVKDLIDPLNAFLLQAHAKGERNVLIIDEAQNLSADVLEQLRLLTNLETNERKLLQIILIGQPELRDMLARPELEQLAQRVIARFHLDALSQAESEQYLQHRLSVAGHHGALPFDKPALQQIQRLSHGVPRRINLLCGRALLGAYATGQRVVNRDIVAKAATEVFGTASAPATDSPRSNTALVAGAGVLAGAALVALGMWWNAAPASSAPKEANVAAQLKPAQKTLAAASAAGDGTPALLFAAAQRDEDKAWWALAATWGPVKAEAGDACNALDTQGLQCVRSSRTSLALVRQLDRPGIVTLFDTEGRPAYAQLVALDNQNATLLTAGGSQKLPLATLAQWWRGDFATLWRMPGEVASASGKTRTRAQADWLQAQLEKLPGNTAPRSGPNSLKAQVARFQLGQGLEPDGQAGPITYLQVNRALGVAEPRLSTSP
ncbi:ExeA family protein [Variovorax sp. HJSM1_2]|uniref:ExeA family protein n=1 Tax=Variovorax sp. HJSM1_2 TaxID=3366263 RepID=UPI003BCAE04A